MSNSEISRVIVPEELPLLKGRNTIIEYVRDEMRTFEQLPFSEVDSLVLCKLCYLHFQGLVGEPKEHLPAVSLQSLFRAENFEQYFKSVFSAKKSREFFYYLCASPRFRDIKLNYHVERLDSENERQFSATTFILPTGDIYVAFRGTDSTVVGWKEDFNMSFQRAVPSQISAKIYLERVALMEHGNMYVGGHSKGGSMAVYSASYCKKSVQQRIVRVFNHDGPSLTKEAKVMANYFYIKDRITTILPHESLIGMIFVGNEYQVVQCYHSGIIQHDPFSWQVGNGDFVYMPDLDKSSYRMGESIREIMEKLTPEERELTIDTVFQIIEATGVESFREFPRAVISQRENLKAIFKTIDHETFKEVRGLVVEILKILLHNFTPIPGGEIGMEK